MPNTNKLLLCTLLGHMYISQIVELYFKLLLQVISIGVATGVILHAVTYLSCGFPKLIHATMEQYEPMKPYFGKKQPENYGWFLKGVEGVTGIMMSVVFVLVVCMSTLKRQNTIKHYVSFSLRVTLHFLLIIHGLYRFQNWYKTTVSLSFNFFNYFFLHISK